MFLVELLIDVRSNLMSSFLKGNYEVDKEIVVKEKEKNNEFEEKAKNSIGGSMVFIEKKKMVWKGKGKKES